MRLCFAQRFVRRVFYVNYVVSLVCRIDGSYDDLFVLLFLTLHQRGIFLSIYAFPEGRNIMAFAPLAKRLKEICDADGVLTTGDWEILHLILENETFLNALQTDGHLFSFDHNQFLKKLGGCAVRVTLFPIYNTVDIVTVMDYLLKLLRYTFSRRRQVMDNMFGIIHRNFAADITALLALLLEKNSILILRPYLCYDLWTNCMEFCLHHVDIRDYNCTLRTCSWILLRVARVAKYCGLMLLVEQMTRKIAEMLRKYLLSLHTSNKTFMLSDDLYVNLLRIFNELLFEFGAKNWYLMSTQSEELSDLIGRAWTDTILLWQSRKFTDKLMSSLNEVNITNMITFNISQSIGNSHFDDLLFTEKDERWCQLIEKLFVRWSHRLPLQIKKELFVNFVQLLISVHRERLLIWYLRAVTSIAVSSVIELLEKEYCTYLWEFTLSVLHSQSQSVSNMQCEEMRIKGYQRDGNHLEQHKSSEYLHSRSRLFSGSCEPIDETAVKEWSFRCAALKFILKASVKPGNVPLPFPKYHVALLQKKYFIRELMDFVGKNLMELWRSLKLGSTDSEILQRDQINLFFTVQNLFSHFYPFCAECDPLLSVLQAFVLIAVVMSLDLPRIIRSDKLTGVDEWLLTLGTEGSWQAADKGLKNTICLKLKEMTLQQLIDHKNGFADKKTASEIVLNYVNEAVHCCSSFREAVFIVEPFIQHGTMTERRKFVTMLRTFAVTVMLEAEENKSERNVNELIIAELILTYLPQLIRIFPTFDAVIDLFLEAAIICYVVQPVLNDGFLPTDELSTKNITYLLGSWFDLYNLLLELHHDLAVEKAHCVFDVFIENSYCREEIMTRINMKNFEKNAPDVLNQILQVWSKYPTLRKYIAPCLTRFDSSHTSSYYHVFPTNVKLEELIALSLRELFFNPFELYPCEVYWYVCQILSSSTFILCVNNSFSDGSVNMRLLKTIRLLLLSICCLIFSPRIYNEGQNMSKFCVDVNYLLANFPERLIRNDYPLVVVIVACIRQACVNLALELDFRRLPFDLSKLSKVCLEINMTNDAAYFLHCHLDRLSDPMRPIMHTLNGNRGFFDMFDGKESTDKPAELFMEILTKMDDADSLRPLSLQIKDNSRVNFDL
ncbi:unnamed protein product [Onchocerca flexuosa]|uniref:Drebrin-like protein n=1 Tax=Onchocerca flexuosa TaxID=387005 RepID=A0A183H0Q2_9BILA|nr:unnamed protein product [Onchocerca flexuosa]